MLSTKVFKKSRERLKSNQQWSSLDEATQADIERVCMVSPWFQGWLEKQPDWPAVAQFIQQAVHAEDELKSHSIAWIINDEETVRGDLRLWRNKHIARLIARDALSLSNVRETALAVSDLADCAVAEALKWSERYWQDKFGEPSVSVITGHAQQLVVIAMGKHGAQELNLSSDIDLIFAYPTQGETTKGRQNEEYFTRVGQKLIQLLDTRTSDGFVFRVDMRLRPWGQSGALVSSFSSLKNYYLQQGRFWERFAMAKARPITADMRTRADITKILLPFVYRSYVDFQAVGALRELKEKIRAEVRRQNLDRNIKLGAGGIREVEFISQVFQLVRGGQDRALQKRGTWTLLPMIGQLELLPETVVTELTVAYDFLRDLEHRIQAINDEQTQNLPIDEEDLARLAVSLNFDSVDGLLAALSQHRAIVSQHFSNLIADNADSVERRTLQPFIAAWQNRGELENSALAKELFEFQQLPSVQRLKPDARENLDQFIPALWSELAQYEDGETRFLAIRPILEAVLRRTSYFVLLAENPSAIKQLVTLAPASSWIAKQLTDKPFLLDELINPVELYRLPNKAELLDDLHQLLLRVPGEDLERQMELLRHFRHARVLRAAACEVTQQLPIMKVSDYLAWVAEVVVEQSLALAWEQMVGRYGRPSKTNGEWCDTDFGVVAYGKMGGLELSYESDLDLVFLHAAAPQGVTEGPSQIDNSVFMARLGQKLIHLLSAATPSGILYEVDTRLRPSGNSGLLVSSLTAFEKYQQEQAWTWEHQALVRARFIAGDTDVKQAFDQIRSAIVCRQRDPSALKVDVVDMRQKMIDHLSSSAKSPGQSDLFDLKQDAGGIVDVEFLVQYLVLAYSHICPPVANWSDNVRTIEALHSQGVITEDEKTIWLNAYLTLRQYLHHAFLQGTTKTLSPVDVTEGLTLVRQQVRTAWQKYLM